mgnify:CR=1 FL=1
MKLLLALTFSYVLGDRLELDYQVWAVWKRRRIFYRIGTERGIQLLGELSNQCAGRRL